MKTIGNLIRLFIMVSISKSIKVVVKRVIAVLAFPTNVPAFIKYAETIHDSMKASTVYSASAAHLTTLANDTATLQLYETACKTKPPTKTIADRNGVIVTVKADLRSARSDVQILADANPNNAIQIITDAGMKVKLESLPGKRKSTAKDSAEQGSVDLEGEGAGPHEFRMSTDNKTWIPLEASITEKLTVTGLTSGTLYYFQNRQMLAKGVKTAWTDSIEFRVK